MESEALEDTQEGCNMGRVGLLDGPTRWVDRTTCLWHSRSQSSLCTQATPSRHMQWSTAEKRGRGVLAGIILGKVAGAYFSSGSLVCADVVWFLRWFTLAGAATTPRWGCS
mmetsp:Transcript_42081/g.111188  ORF Transcript_42081/g.111188 Transcript_42081/m.111188 type:complete len:111 (-) Transcript_42081:65-397(-)